MANGKLAVAGRMKGKKSTKKRTPIPPNVEYVSMFTGQPPVGSQGSIHSNLSDEALMQAHMAEVERKSRLRAFSN
jgi:hypothetical protein